MNAIISQYACRTIEDFDMLLRCGWFSDRETGDAPLSANELNDEDLGN
jgi:hypothetical protein